MRENLIGLVELVAEEMGVDFKKPSSGFAVVKMTEDSPLNFSAGSAHFLSLCLVLRLLTKRSMTCFKQV